MLGTLAIIFGLSTLVFTLVMSLAGIFDLVTLGIFVVGFNIIQWLISPYIIGALYRAKELSRTDNEKLHKIVETLSEKSKITKVNAISN
jgi:Zn-dependent protease with chaperone function